MISKEEMIRYIGEKYNTFPEYIFEKFPTYCVFRHERGEKWFCLLMTIQKKKLYGKSAEKIDVINLKIDPVLGDIVRNAVYIYPAYHMNKEHWITIDLSQVDTLDQLAILLEDSYQLTIK